MSLETSVLIDGLGFGESPRWHDGKLWFSDILARQVMTVDLEGKAETVVEVPGRPSGLGWLPDGRLLVVSMTDSRLLRLDPDGLAEMANLRGLASGYCNDMVVDQQGHAYVGNYGFDLEARQPFAPAKIIMVTPDGDARVVADELAFPNGAVITPDGGTLIVAESYASRLTAFQIEPDGSLVERRLWAQLEKAVPDGICLDADVAVWIASPGSDIGEVFPRGSTQVLRVREGGEVTHRIQVSTQAYACMLGGHERRTLFIFTAERRRRDEGRTQLSGRVEMLEVDIPGAGLP